MTTSSHRRAILSRSPYARKKAAVEKAVKRATKKRKPNKEVR